jgi:ABC-type sugar transport systems, permease components
MTPVCWKDDEAKITRNIGLASYYLKALGYEWNHTLKGDQAMFLVILASSWGRISYNFLFFLAGLQAIPKSIMRQQQ